MGREEYNLNYDSAMNRGCANQLFQQMPCYRIALCKLLSYQLKNPTKAKF